MIIISHNLLTYCDFKRNYYLAFIIILMFENNKHKLDRFIVFLKLKQKYKQKRLLFTNS